MPLLMHLPNSVQRRLDAVWRDMSDMGNDPGMDFSKPPGEEALLLPGSVSWRVFKNPISVFIGGVAAVILELAEPAVRTGVWEYSRFRDDPIGRLRRTGLAAMITVYGARSIAEAMIAKVARMHAAVQGVTPCGVPFRAADPDLLRWVHATAAYGFVAAYGRYANALSAAEIDEFYREGVSTARLYGATCAPPSNQERQVVFDSMQGRLQPSPIVFEFLHIMRAAPALPRPLLWMQGTLVRAAVELLPSWVRARLGLDDSYGLGPLERSAVRAVAALADRILLPASPPAQSCVRLGLPAAYLYG